MSKIAFNLSSLTTYQAGVKIHTLNLIKYFKLIDSKIYIYIPKDSLSLLDSIFIKNSKIVSLPFAANSKIIKLLYEQIFIPIHAFFNGVKFIHSFDYSAPIFFYGEKTITIHDLNYINNKDSFSYVQKIIRSYLYPLGIRKSKKIFTISHTVKNEILDFFRCLNIKKKINVIYNGYEHLIKDSDIDSRFDKHVLFNENDSFFISVGSLNPHKNYPRLINAFKKINSNFKLFIIGRDTNNYSNVLSKLILDNNLQEKVIIYTNISNKELSLLYKYSNALILPSLYEGFGIPIIEGLYYDKDILCSDIKIFNEIGKEFVTFFNPYDVDDISKKINLYIDRNINIKSRKNRKDVLNKYSWENAAKKLSCTINEIL